jgi:hypothetical protein
VAMSGRAGAGGRIALHATVCVRVEDLLGWFSGRAGRLRSEETPEMDSPELVAVPCRECRRSPVEVLKRLRHGRQCLWCPQCRAIWVVERSASLTEPDPK